MAVAKAEMACESFAIAGQTVEVAALLDETVRWVVVVAFGQVAVVG